MNEYDLLLQWLSARPRGEARTALLQEACLALDQRAAGSQGIPQQSRWPERFRDTLYRCGHIEQIGLDMWAVMPPTVLWLGGTGKRQQGEAHVYGARSPCLQEQLQQTWGSQFVVLLQENGPAVWKWVGTCAQSEAFARSFGSTVYAEQGESLLEALPNLEQAVWHFPAGSFPTGNGWEFWHVTDPTRGAWWHWGTMPKTREQGLYRAIRRPRLWIYVSPQPQSATLCAYRLDPVQNPDHLYVAKWYELARHVAHSDHLSLRYNASEHTLMIPSAGVALPIIIDRALRLASGYCPRTVSETRGRALIFAKISRRRAYQVKRVLGIPLEITHG